MTMISNTERTSLYYKLLTEKLQQKRLAEVHKLNKEKEIEFARRKADREKLENSMVEIARYEQLKYIRNLVNKNKLGVNVDITV